MWYQITNFIKNVLIIQWYIICMFLICSFTRSKGRWYYLMNMYYSNMILSLKTIYGKSGYEAYLCEKARVCQQVEYDRIKTSS